MSGSVGLTAIEVSLWGPTPSQLTLTLASFVGAVEQIASPFLSAGPAAQTAPATGASSRLLWTNSTGRSRPSSAFLGGDGASDERDDRDGRADDQRESSGSGAT